VAEGARFFAAANRDVLTNPRVRLILGDARSYVASTATRYDIISSEPSNPWMAGIGSLFTVEQFRACRRVLAPDGVMCQWIHGADIGAADLATVARSFLAVFPEATLWTTGTSADLLLVSRRDRLALNLAALGRRMDQDGIFARPPESQWMPSATTVAARLVMGSQDLARFASYGRLNTDDFPVLEFSAPRSLYSTGSYEANANALAATLTRSPTDLINLDGSGLSYADFVEQAAEVRLPPLYAPLAKAAAMDLTNVVARNPQDAKAHYLLGLALRERGDGQAARRALQAAVRLEPKNEQYRKALDAALHPGPKRDNPG
jgi:spermidine synthase